MWEVLVANKLIARGRLNITSVKNGLLEGYPSSQNKSFRGWGGEQKDGGWMGEPATYTRYELQLFININSRYKHTIE